MKPNKNKSIDIKPKEKVIARHQDLTDTERKVKKLRRKLSLQNKEFRKAQKLNRPKLDKDKALSVFSENAEDTSRLLSDLALKVMSLQTAYSYAESMVSQDVEGEGVEWSIDSALKISEKIQTIETTRIMLKHYGISKAISNAILAQTILKQFGIPNITAATVPSSPSNSLPTFTTADVKKVLEEYGKDIKGKP